MEEDEAFWARYSEGGAVGLMRASTRALMIEIFDVATSWMLFALQMALRPALFQASQAFSASEGLTKSGLDGEEGWFL